MMTVIWLVAGLVVLTAGAELLVRGSSKLAVACGISPLVIGLTIVAYGTSAPELAVSTKAAWMGKPDIAVANVIGSNIFNVLFVLGACALIKPLVVAQQLVRLDAPLMVGVSVLFLVLAWDGNLGWFDGALLLGGMVWYTIFAIRKSRQESRVVAEEYNAAFGEPAAPVRQGKHIAIQVGYIAAGLVLLVLGGRWLVDSAVVMARAWGVSETVIGLTIVAAGTSLPEVATSVVATIRGQRDIAIGNVVGSSIYNILAILGVTSLVAGGNLPISPGLLHFDIPVMIAVAVACLPVFFTGHTINRWEGALFLGYYVAYTAYLVLATQNHAALPTYSSVMLWFVIPLTVITLAVVTVRSWRRPTTA